jgi:LysM repeat protein
MKKILFLFLLAPLFTGAQEKTLLAEGVSPNLYLNHKVEPKENYYSIGRIYNISPKDIAPFNNLQLESGLSLGQQIKIPLNSTNFFQSGNAGADETFVPVYHAVKDKEGLFRVAANHYELPLETLKQWNNIKGDAVKKGTKLIVGYLKVKTAQSGLAKKGIGTSINSNTIAVVKPEEKKAVENDKKTAIAETKKVDPVVEKKETVKPKPAEPVKQDVEKAEKKEAVKPEKEKTAVESKKTPSVNNLVGGVFKDTYESQTNNAQLEAAEGTAGVFKSTSGWADKKYYCLHNSASPGTIIKVTNPANGKFVFAKVLDLMPDIKQNEGLLLIISNAAADELGAAEGNFNCKLNFSK